jgi:hypothetical protein
MKLKYFVIITGVLAVGVGGYVAKSQIDNPKPLRSFVVTMTMSSPKKDSPYLMTTTVITAVRSDGNWVHSGSIPGGGRVWYERDIHNFDTGVLTIVDELTQSLTTRAIKPHDLKMQRVFPAESCTGKAAGQILGLDVTYVEEKSEMKLPDGDVWTVTKKWLAPDLGCFVLQKENIWTRKSDGMLLADTKFTPISVVFQDVSSFFEIPTGYQERSPGEVMRLRSTLYPNEIPMPSDTSGPDNVYKTQHDALGKKP